jgi:hypothetical protein
MPCSDCKYWRDSEVPGYDVPKNVRRCLNAIEIWEASEWTKEDDGEDSYTDRQLKPEYADHKMFANDGSSYAASFLTRGDFHCSEHQPKE